MDVQLQTLDQVRVTAIDLAIKFGPKLVVALIIVIAGVFVGRAAGRATGRAIARFHLEPPARMLLERIARIFVIALFAIMALQNLGVELLPLIAGVGVAGAGVALAMQGVLGNIVAGLTIILTQPYRVGDYISIQKEEGEVLDINLSSTTLGHPDLSKVVIPNRKIVGEILHNYGRVRQLDLEVGVGYATDIPATLAAIREVLGANPRVLKDPVAEVSVVRLGDAVSIRVAPWVGVPDYVVAGGELNAALLARFHAANIDIAMPRREVHLVGKAG